MCETPRPRERRGERERGRERDVYDSDPTIDGAVCIVRRSSSSPPPPPCAGAAAASRPPSARRRGRAARLRAPREASTARPRGVRRAAPSRPSSRCTSPRRCGLAALHPTRTPLCAQDPPSRASPPRTRALKRCIPAAGWRRALPRAQHGRTRPRHGAGRDRRAQALPQPHCHAARAAPGVHALRGVVRRCAPLLSPRLVPFPNPRTWGRRRRSARQTPDSQPHVVQPG